MSQDPVLAAWESGGLAAVDALDDATLRRSAARTQTALDVLHPEAARDAKLGTRTTSTGTQLTITGSPPAEVVQPSQMIEAQIADGITAGRRDGSGDPRWDFGQLDMLVGPMVPGRLWLVGALPANGKTALLFSQMTAMADYGIPTVYLPLEMDPHDLRRQLAAWQLGLDTERVLANEWDRLAPDARDRHEAEMLRQTATPIHFPPDRSVTLARLAHWMKWGVEQVGAKLIVVDHFHRMDFGDDSGNYRVAITKAIRAMKDLAREHQVALVATCQLNGDHDPLDRYLPPQLRRLKESSALGEEADVVLMLSRKLSAPLSREEAEQVRAGLRSVRDFEEPEIMQVTCRKHRFADKRARDRTVQLKVVNGRVINYTKHLGDIVVRGSGPR